MLGSCMEYNAESEKVSLEYEMWIEREIELRKSYALGIFIFIRIESYYCLVYIG